MKYSIDSILIRENTISITGWAIGDVLADVVNYRIETKKHEPMENMSLVLPSSFCLSRG